MRTRHLLAVVLWALWVTPVFAFPANPALTTFTGTDGTSLPAHNTNWSNCVIFGASSSAFTIQDNAVSVSDSAENDACWATTFNANSEAYITLNTNGTANDFTGVWVRLANIGANTTDGYGVEMDVDNNLVRIFRLDNGVGTLLGSTIAQTVAAGDSVGVTAISAQICAWFKSGAGAWTNIGCRTDATYGASGKIGFTAINGNTTIGMLDDFGGGNSGTYRMQAKTAFSNNNAANPSTVSASFDATPALGNFVTVQMGFGNAGTEAETFTFSDNQATGGNTYTVDINLSNNTVMGTGIAIGSAQITKTSGTFTVTGSIPNTLVRGHYMWLAIQEWAGLATSGALDKTSSINNAAGPSSTAPDTGTTAALSQANEVIIAAAIHGSGAAVTITDEQTGTVPASGWTAEYNADGATQQGGVANSVVVSATTGVRHVWLLSSSQRWLGILATYKVAQSATPRNLMLLGVGP